MDMCQTESYFNYEPEKSPKIQWMWKNSQVNACVDEFNFTLVSL